MITKEELTELQKSHPKQSELWTKAFRDFNDNRDMSKMMFPLTMNCRSCYFTVLKWHEKRLSGQFNFHNGSIDLQGDNV
jgi:hypothetical protein